MIGELTSVDNGPQRNVKLTIAADEVFSEIADPPGSLSPSDIVEYHARETLFEAGRLISLEFVLRNGSMVTFYRTRTMLDFGLLLDWLDAVIGFRPRTWVERIAEPGGAGNSHSAGE